MTHHTSERRKGREMNNSQNIGSDFFTAAIKNIENFIKKDDEKEEGLCWLFNSFHQSYTNIYAGWWENIIIVGW